ncbi:MAG: MurR/RpiR family transcriptional regulator [Chloroflexota bacterium]
MENQKFDVNTPLAAIQANMDGFSKAEAKVAQWVLAHPAGVAASTIADTAAQAGVSEATVVRFCKSAGYKGYLNFRFALTQMLANPMNSIHSEIQPTDTVPQIAERIIYASIASLQDTLSHIDPAQLEQAVEAVRGARQVLIVGVGTSAPFALDLYNKLIRLGLPCEAVNDPYIQLTRLALLTPEDVVVAVSHSGASAEPVDALRYARERDITTIAITGSVPSPITQHSDIILQYSARETRLEPIIARISLLAVSDVFFTVLAMQDIVHADENEKRIWELVITHTVAG